MRANKKEEKKLVLNQWGVTVVYIFMIAIAICAVYLISKSFTNEIVPKTPIATYKQSPNVTYVVKLKDNEFFDSKTLPMNRHYITRIIDYIDANFNYEFDSDKITNIKYTYDITGVLTGKNTTSEGEVEVWTKTYTLLKEQSKEVSNGNSFEISEKLPIDYKYYQEVVDTFKSTIGLNIDAVLNVRLTVHTSGTYGSKQINETSTTDMIIPVGTSTMKIDITSSNIGPHTIFDMDEDKEELVIDYVKLFIGTLLATFALIGIAYATSHLLKLTRKTEFTMELNRILKNYGDVIAESNTIPDLSKLEVMDIVSFQDMVDIEEELRSPIIFTRVADDIAWFTITHGDRIYRYIID